MYSICTPLEYNYEIDTSLIKKVLLIDQRTPYCEDLVSSLNADTFAIVYTKDSDRYDLVTLLQDKFHRIERIGLMFPMIPYQKSKCETLFLGQRPFFNELEKIPYSLNVEFLIHLLLEFSVGKLDFLSCKLLRHSAWKHYFSILKQETGVCVYASEDDTGVLKYGDHWVSELSVEEVDQQYFSEVSFDYWKYVSNEEWDDSPQAQNLEKDTDEMQHFSLDKEGSITETENDVGEGKREDMMGLGLDLSEEDLAFYEELKKNAVLSDENKKEKMAVYADRMMPKLMVVSGRNLKKIQFGNMENNIAMREKNVLNESSSSANGGAGSRWVVNSRSRKRGGGIRMSFGG